VISFEARDPAVPRLPSDDSRTVRPDAAAWLIGVGWAVYDGRLFGRWFHDAWLRAWADSPRGATEPGREESGQDAEGKGHRLGSW
jgi:hypothetical protein